MESIEEQLRVQMRKAFWDLLQEKVEADPPDVEWLTRLYAEIRDRLCRYVKRGGRVYNKIHGSYDPTLFEQMLRHGAFQSEEMVYLIDLTFRTIAMLQAPVRDEVLKQKQAQVSKLCQEGRKFSEVVPLFLKSSHELMDFIDEDLRKIQEKSKEGTKSGRTSETHIGK